MAYFLIVVFGAVIGSFLNVCIYRIPLNRSIMNPPSHCPFCGKLIKWYCNVPLLSFLLLRGKCHDCGRPIPLRYFFVELVTAIAGVLLFFAYSSSPQFFFYWVFTWILIVVSGIDVEHHVIPDALTVPAACAGFIFFVLLRIDGSASFLMAAVNSSLGILAGALSMIVLGFIGEIIFRKESIGGGDVKLLAMIGAFLGWKLVILVFVLAPLFGGAAALVIRRRYRKMEIAYGPYLSLGAFMSALAGVHIMSLF